MNFNDVLKNLRGGLETQGERVLGNITDGWDALKNLNSISLPNIDLKNLFRNSAQMTSATAFNGVGSNDTTQTDILSGITDIWTKNSQELGNIVGNENKGTTKYVINNDVVTSGKQYGKPNEISETEYNSWANRGENGKNMQITLTTVWK